MNSEKLHITTEQVTPMEFALPAVDPDKFQPRGAEYMGAIGSVTLGSSGERNDGQNYKGVSSAPGQDVHFD